MSRSKKDDFAKNPATRFFDWAGGKGEVVYYDQDAKENVTVPLPFRFLVLDEVMTVGGGVDNDDGYIGFWSNAIRSRDAKIKKLTVRSSHNGKKRVEAVGTWAEIKASLVGAKYVKGLYIGYYNDDKELEIGYLKVKGSALMPWVNFNEKRRDVTLGAFSIVDKASKKKGSNTFFEPVFEWTDNVRETTEAAAIELDEKVLQPYLTAYFSQDVSAEPVSDDLDYTGTQDDSQAWPPLDRNPVVPEDLDDEPPF